MEKKKEKIAIPELYSLQTIAKQKNKNEKHNKMNLCSLTHVESYFIIYPIRYRDHRANRKCFPERCDFYGGAF